MHTVGCGLFQSTLGHTSCCICAPTSTALYAWVKNMIVQYKIKPTQLIVSSHDAIHVEVRCQYVVDQTAA